MIKRCNQGDPSAWEEFYARYLGMISCAVRRHCKPGADELDDVVQEVFISLFKALKDYDPARSLEAYILEITRRVRISRFRRASALKRGGANPISVPISAHDAGQENGYVSLASPTENQETSLIRARERSKLRRALMELSDSCRELLGLRYEQELSYKELASKLQAKEGTLRVRVQRCLSSLAKIYTGSLAHEAGSL